MFEIDKCSNDQERNKNPVCNRHLPRKGLPDDQEQERSDQFHREIAKGDFRAAIRAATAKQNPANQRQILVPGNLLFARRAKRATRFVNRKIDRPAINADVQKRSDCRPEKKGKRTQKKLVNRMSHVRLFGDQLRSAALH